MNEELKAKIAGLPLLINNEDKKLIDHNKELDALGVSKKRIERRVWIKICAETDTVEVPSKKADEPSTFKEVPKYTNEKQREAASDSELGIDNDYIQLTQQEIMASQNAKLVVIEKDYLERQFKAAGMLVKLLEVER